MQARFVSVWIVVVGLLVVGMGIHGFREFAEEERFAMMNGCLTLGGAFLIAGLFSLKMPVHGIIGAGVVALLGAARGFANLPGVAAFLIGDRPRGNAPVIEAAVTVLCLMVLVTTMRWFFRERIRRMLENS